MRNPNHSLWQRVWRTIVCLVALLALELAVWGLIQGFIRAVLSGDFDWFDHSAVLWVPVPGTLLPWLPGWVLLWVTAIVARLVLSLAWPKPRPTTASRRLLRLSLWVVATVIATLTLIGMLTNRTGLGELINGDVVWVDAPVHVLWFSFPAKLLWLGVMLAAYVFLVYLGVVYRVHVQETNIKRAVEQPSIDVERLADRVADISLSSDQRTFYVEMLLDPALRIERIMESLDPYERSVVLRTRYTIDLEDVDDPVFIPIELAARGRTEDGFQIEHPGDRPATNVSYLQSAAIAAAVIRDLIDSSGRSSLKQYQARTQPDGKSMEEGVLGQLARFPRRADDDRMRDLQALASLSRNIMGIKARLRDSQNLYVVVRLLHRFHQSHPVTIVVAGDVDSEGVNGRSTQVEVRRRVVPISSSLPRGDYWRLVVRGSRNVVVIFRVGLNKLTSFIRHFFGVRSSALSFPLTNAGRARSYHLEFKGPADTYMARQGFEDLRGSPLGILGEPQESAVSPARGQRHSHLYIRNGDPWLSRVRYRVSYFERTPGSMAIAFAAAASALLISIIISWNQALLVKDTDASGLLQLLFAFPVATAAAGVVMQSRARWGGVLSARIANMVTFAATLGALWVSSLPTTFDALSKVWFAIIGVLAFVSAACLGSWIVRLFVHATFLDAREDQ